MKRRSGIILIPDTCLSLYVIFLCFLCCSLIFFFQLYQKQLKKNPATAIFPGKTQSPQLVSSLGLNNRLIFNTNQNQQYSESHAKTRAYWSMITHCSRSQIQNWSCALCKRTLNKLERVTVVENATNDISGFIGYDSVNNLIVISWRGTVSIVNWEINLQFNKVAYVPNNGQTCNKCQIHSGFYKAYKSVSLTVQTELTKLRTLYPTASVTTTGHSLGGALAFVCALQLTLKYPDLNLQNVYNFGCPRVGNSLFIDFAKSHLPSIFRVVHNRDIVPHVPLVSMGFIHPAYEILYDEPMTKYKICNSSGQDKLCSDKFAPFFNPIDHTKYWVATDSSIC